MSWPKSIISSDWGNATAIAPNGENIVVFAYHIWEVRPDGKWTQIGSEWPKTVAATTNANFIYAIRPDGFIYKISTLSYTNVFKWAEVGGGWEKAKAIFAYNDHIYVVLDAIWEIRLDGTYQKVQNEYWGLHDLSQILSSGWAKTFQLLTLDDKLFVYDVFLTIVDTNTGAKTVVHKDDWNSTLAGCATANAMYTAFANRISLWKVQIQGDSDEELNKLKLRKEDQPLLTRKISSYFTVNRLKAATLHGRYLCDKDEKYCTFTEFIQAAKKLKPSEPHFPYYCYNLKINDDDTSCFEKSMELPITNFIEMVPWKDDTTWRIYVVTCNLLRQCEKTEKIKNQVINFIAVEEGFVSAKISPQNPYDPLPT
ncbi:hypothetical protein C1646_774763 [Rhizophagus diaphanus]|nr:hypothetical protein C1646_774763 [Rhizophagus diaphanus] [Rhizophagus sp. MUCL 43196]